ncbi:hypothetical protein ACFOZ0_10130 [Streptomyces yaanensis]|uniref:Uncharacterized protein n=1 Tax=Streptomyces yaanensis TaxID=1142239 RepID=A0ABV7S9D5_9ACTN|nr:hypothetical protein [Streptomyces sp. CGMCC 4.7035]WNB96707.1 hypothetical protein Q2K21_00720 [Streptomyces sp. CGMCC 4.7035]
MTRAAPSSRQLRHAALARELAARDDADPERLARHPRAAGPMAPATASAPSRRPALGQGGR